MINVKFNATIFDFKFTHLRQQMTGHKAMLYHLIQTKQRLPLFTGRYWIRWNDFFSEIANFYQLKLNYSLGKFIKQIINGWTIGNTYRMHVGNREYVPVVRISTAAGIWKFGRRACTNVSRAIRAKVSAVSTKSIDCLSKKFIICCNWKWDCLHEYCEHFIPYTF